MNVCVQIFGYDLADHNYIYGEIKCRLNSGNAWYLSVQNILSSDLVKVNQSHYRPGQTLWVPGF
jgi:hypothetical protein